MSTWKRVAFVLLLAETATLAVVFVERSRARHLESAFNQERIAHQAAAAEEVVLQISLGKTETENATLKKSLAEERKQVTAEKGPANARVPAERRDSPKAKALTVDPMPLEIGEDIGPVTVPGKVRPVSGRVMNISSEGIVVRTQSEIVGVPLESLQPELRKRVEMVLAPHSP